MENANAGVVSPDGLWRWDGSVWQPNAAPPPPGPPYYGPSDDPSDGPWPAYVANGPRPSSGLPAQTTGSNLVTCRGGTAPPPVLDTILVSAVFGIFGLILAAVHSNKARAMGHARAPYWIAFAVTCPVNLVLVAEFVLPRSV